MAQAAGRRSLRCAGFCQTRPEDHRSQSNGSELALVQRNNARLTRRLERAEAIVDLQKKVADLLDIPLAPNGDEPLPNEVWSWDITRLMGPTKWSYFYLYV